MVSGEGGLEAQAPAKMAFGGSISTPTASSSGSGPTFACSSSTGGKAGELDGFYSRSKVVAAPKYLGGRRQGDNAQRRFARKRRGSKVVSLGLVLHVRKEGAGGRGIRGADATLTQLGSGPSRMGCCRDGQHGRERGGLRPMYTDHCFASYNSQRM